MDRYTAVSLVHFTERCHCGVKLWPISTQQTVDTQAFWERTGGHFDQAPSRLVTVDQTHTQSLRHLPHEIRARVTPWHKIRYLYTCTNCGVKPCQTRISVAHYILLDLYSTITCLCLVHLSHEWVDQCEKTVLFWWRSRQPGSDQPLLSVTQSHCIWSRRLHPES